MRCLVYREAEAGRAEGYRWLGEGRFGNGGGCLLFGQVEGFFQGGGGGFGLRRRKGYDF
jgi:hypothetical protein